jgi:hypothetical protein
MTRCLFIEEVKIRNNSKRREEGKKRRRKE